MYLASTRLKYVDSQGEDGVRLKRLWGNCEGRRWWYIRGVGSSLNRYLVDSCLTLSGHKNTNNLTIVVLPHCSSPSINAGILFLQLGEETRRVHLTHELTSLETLRALIVHMFPQRLTMAMLRYARIT